MRLYFILIIYALLSSCVSTKKYRLLQSSFTQSQIELQASKNQFIECSLNSKELERNIILANHENSLKNLTIESVKNECKLKDDRIKDLDQQLSFVKTSNEDLIKRIDGLSNSNNVNIEIMKKLLEDQEVEQLKVLNLSLALQKQDSLNIHLVKKSKRKISDDKLKRTLEKLGFVFF
jgi:chemotaxis protein MotB